MDNNNLNNANGIPSKAIQALGKIRLDQYEEPTWKLNYTENGLNLSIFWPDKIEPAQSNDTNTFELLLKTLTDKLLPLNQQPQQNSQNLFQIQQNQVQNQQQLLNTHLQNNYLNSTVNLNHKSHQNTQNSRANFNQNQQINHQNTSNNDILTNISNILNSGSSRNLLKNNKHANLLNNANNHTNNSFSSSISNETSNATSNPLPTQHLNPISTPISNPNYKNNFTNNNINQTPSTKPKKFSPTQFSKALRNLAKVKTPTKPVIKPRIKSDKSLHKSLNNSLNNLAFKPPIKTYANISKFKQLKQNSKIRKILKVSVKPVTEKLVLERIEQDRNLKFSGNGKNGQIGKKEVDTETNDYSNILKLLRILEKSKLKKKNSGISGLKNHENNSQENESLENKSLGSPVENQIRITPNKKRKLSPPSPLLTPEEQLSQLLRLIKSEKIM